MKRDKIIIGSRGSKLALIYAEKVKFELEKEFSNKNSPNSKEIILCELNNFPSAQIPMFYLVNFFRIFYI